ncbi:hypothetical protein Aduo_007152 [Ancylostoma duodenale]
MDVLKDIPTDTINTIYHSFLYFELFLHTMGYGVSAVFLSIFLRLHSIHINLRWIFGSFILAACITSAWRMYYYFQILILDIIPGNDVLSLSSDMRGVCMFAGALHLFMLAAERQVATIRSETYENESHIIPLCVTVVGLWGFSYTVMFSLKGLFVKDFITASIFSVVYAISLAVRENVASATYLYKCFLVFSVQAIIGWLSVVLYLVFRKIYKVPVLEKLFGFVFDVMIALPTTTVPVTIVSHNDKLREQFCKIRNKVCPSSYISERANVRQFVDFEGRQIKVEVSFGTSIYTTNQQEKSVPEVENPVCDRCTDYRLALSTHFLFLIDVEALDTVGKLHRRQN